MAIARSCDMCDKPEIDGRFVQHYTLLPSRQVGTTGYEPRGRRSIDLCGDCATAWTQPTANYERRPRTLRPTRPAGR